MACVHNQVKINFLNGCIKKKENQIIDLNINIEKCNIIKQKHDNFNNKLNCVINNLAGNTIVSGVSYDGGKMTECLNSSNQTITDCDNIIEESNKKILLLTEEISKLQMDISSLEGMCSDCLAALKQEV